MVVITIPSHGANRQKTYKTVCSPRLKVLSVEQALFCANRSQMTKYVGMCILISDGYQLVGESAMSMCVKAESLRKTVYDMPHRDVERYLFPFTRPQPMNTA